jgi:transposase-like protein
VKQLQALQERRLEGYDLRVLLLGGKTFVEDAMVIALGITLTGEEVLLSFVRTAPENERGCAAFLRNLVGRGLRADQGLLSVIAVAQRCQ